MAGTRTHPIWEVLYGDQVVVGPDLGLNEEEAKEKVRIDREDGIFNARAREAQ